MSKPLANSAVPLYLRTEAADLAQEYANRVAAFGPTSSEAEDMLAALHQALDDVRICIRAAELKAAGE